MQDRKVAVSVSLSTSVISRVHELIDKTQETTGVKIPLSHLVEQALIATLEKSAATPATESRDE